MKIAAVQMVPAPAPSTTARRARLIAEAAQAGAALVALPEYFCFMGRTDRDKLSIAEAPGDGPLQQMLSDAAREHGIWLIGGTLPIRTDDPDRVLNANCVYAPDGALAARYDKIHLFKYDTAASATTKAARSVPALRDDLPGRCAEVGLSVCYDLRFPELYRALMHPPCDLISVPAAFTHTTGLAHWELLLRAPRVENQCYVIAAAQGGLHEKAAGPSATAWWSTPWGRC